MVDTQTHIHTQSEYCNPRVHARRALIIALHHKHNKLKYSLHENIDCQTQTIQVWTKVVNCHHTQNKSQARIMIDGSGMGGVRMWHNMVPNIAGV